MPSRPLSAGLSTLGSKSRWAAYMLAMLCIALSVIVGPYSASRHGLSFDDAYGYLRYALHIRRGLGVAWNSVPTYGPISQLWAWVLVPFSALPVSGAFALQLASWLAGLGGLAAVAVTVSRHATSSMLRLRAGAFVAVSLPLLLNSRFNYQLTTGMDTMLSLMANALVVGCVLYLAAAPSVRRIVLTAVISLIAVLARPENLPCALVSPILAAWFTPHSLRWRLIGAFLAAFFLLYTIDLLVCRSYFGVAFPLSFLVDGSTSYAGFMTGENGLEYAFAALACMLPYIGVLAMSWRHGDRRLNLALLLPAAVTFCFLIGQRQHMGFQGRYFLPLLPYLMAPALLSWDVGMSHGIGAASRRALIGIVGALLIYGLSMPLQHFAVRQFLNATRPQASVVPELVTGSRDPLPQVDWAANIATVGGLVAKLPPQVVVAATEVGFLGASSPDKTVIDLVGLNDNDIARNGFSTQRLLDRAPDLIWFPPADYTGLRSQMLSQARLLSEYELVAGAFNYGLAIRLSSPYRAQIDAAVGAAWSQFYPKLSLQDYVVSQLRTP